MDFEVQEKYVNGELDYEFIEWARALAAYFCGKDAEMEDRMVGHATIQYTPLSCVQAQQFSILLNTIKKAKHQRNADNIAKVMRLETVCVPSIYQKYSRDVMIQNFVKFLVSLRNMVREDEAAIDRVYEIVEAVYCFAASYNPKIR